MSNKTTKKPLKTEAKNKTASKPSMTEAPRPPIEDVVAVKMMRDATIKEKVYFDRKVMLALSAGLVLSLATNLFYATRKPDIQYFATNSRGEILALTALNEPVHNTETVLNWATQSITAAYTFSFSNYRAELQGARPAFTQKGWEGFQEALQSSNVLQDVVNNKFVTSAVPRGAPVIIAEGQLGGNFAWKIQMPMLVTYESSQNRQSQDLMVTAVIVRRSELEHPMGLGIAQIIAQ